MVNSKKKINKSTVAIVVLALLLVLSLVLTATGAWFTDKKDGAEITKTFGTVELKVTADDFGKVTRVSNEAGTVTEKIMPGDTITYDLTVEKATGSEDFWYAVAVTITGLDNDITTTLSPADVKDVSTTTKVTGFVELKGTNYGNSFQGKTVKLSYTVYAVQKANVANAADALKSLQDATAKDAA